MKGCSLLFCFCVHVVLVKPCPFSLLANNWNLHNSLLQIETQFSFTCLPRAVYMYLTILHHIAHSRLFIHLTLHSILFPRSVLSVIHSHPIYVSICLPAALYVCMYVCMYVLVCLTARIYLCRYISSPTNEHLLCLSTQVDGLV